MTKVTKVIIITKMTEMSKMTNKGPKWPSNKMVKSYCSSQCHCRTWCSFIHSFIYFIFHWSYTDVEL